MGNFMIPVKSQLLRFHCCFACAKAIAPCCFQNFSSHSCFLPPTAVARKKCSSGPNSGTLEVLEAAEVSESFLILVGLGGFWVWRASRHFWKFCPNNSKKGYFPSKPLVVLAGNQVPVTAGALRKNKLLGFPGFSTRFRGILPELILWMKHLWVSQHISATWLQV